MDKTLITWMVVYAVAVAAIVELYKKTLRKDEAKSWECLLIAGIVCAVGGLFIGRSFAQGMEIPLMVVLFAVQYLLDMEIVKRVFKAFMRKVIDE